MKRKIESKTNKKKILLNYQYELFPFTTASYIEMAILRRDDLILLRRDDLPFHTPDYIINIEPIPYCVQVRGVPSCYWEIDNHVIMGNDIHFYANTDIVLLAQKFFAPHYEQFKTEWVPLAADPTVHKNYDDEEIKYQIGLIGNGTYPERRKLLNKLATKYKVLTGEAKPGEEYSRKLNSCEIVFNRSMNADVNMRVFEALSCGRLLITDIIPTQDELFEEGVHYVGYKNGTELMEKVDYYLKNPEKASKIALEGQKHVHLNHNYDIRLCQIIKILDSIPK